MQKSDWLLRCFELQNQSSKERESKKRKNNETTNASSSKDIRAFFEKRRTVSSTKKVGVPKYVVELSDDNECGLDLTFNLIFFLTFSCYFQYLLFVTVEKRNKNEQKMGFVEFFLRD